jgi:hypothetical protein
MPARQEIDMANWIDKWRMKREQRIAAGEPLTAAEHEMYRGGWAKAGRLVGTLIARRTGRRDAPDVAERTAAKVGEFLARRMDQRIAERRGTEPRKR